MIIFYLFISNLFTRREFIYDKELHHWRLILVNTTKTPFNLSYLYIFLLQEYISSNMFSDFIAPNFKKTSSFNPTNKTFRDNFF